MKFQRVHSSFAGLPQVGQRPAPRSVEDIQNILSRVKREGLVRILRCFWCFTAGIGYS